MVTIVIEDVPDWVVERLERRAASEGLSLSDLLVRELAAIARREEEFELIRTLPHFGAVSSRVVDDLETGRRER